ncbi:hypothetical protein ACFPIJ_00070 [Dactylosporangium cerinum]|uniref:FAD:protein FMN transferase n=1 Tax=Dactylosporangium cerinum TaxID=1434730 RepID=A0ABV9VJG6_9ACTN
MYQDSIPHTRMTGAAMWPVWNTTMHLLVTLRDQLPDARRLVIDQVAAIDEACNPFRADSEVRALQPAEGRQVRVSALLAELVAVSLRAAVLSEGDLDPLAGDRPPHTGTTGGEAPDWRRISRVGARPHPAGGPGVVATSRLLSGRYRLIEPIGKGGMSVVWVRTTRCSSAGWP